VSAEIQRVTQLRPGDVVFQVNRTPIADADDLERALTAAAGRGPVTLWFERRGATWRATFSIR